MSDTPDEAPVTTPETETPVAQVAESPAPETETTEAPAEEPVEQADEGSGVGDFAGPPPAVSVVGTPAVAEPTLGEHTTEAQPLAPAEVPATAAPAVDQVTINTHLRKVSSELHAVKTYIETFLAGHPVVKDVVKTLEDTISVVEDSVK